MEKTEIALKNIFSTNKEVAKLCAQYLVNRVYTENAGIILMAQWPFGFGIKHQDLCPNTGILFQQFCEIAARQNTARGWSRLSQIVDIAIEHRHPYLKAFTPFICSDAEHFTEEQISGVLDFYIESSTPIDSEDLQHFTNLQNESWISTELKQKIRLFFSSLENASWEKHRMKQEKEVQEIKELLGL